MDDAFVAFVIFSGTGALSCSSTPSLSNNTLLTTNKLDSYLQAFLPAEVAADNSRNQQQQRDFQGTAPGPSVSRDTAHPPQVDGIATDRSIYGCSLETSDAPSSTSRANNLARQLIGSGAAVGMACASIAAFFIVLQPGIFTFDQEVVATMRSLAPLVCGCISTLGVMCAMEGMLLATKDLRFLSTFYSVNSVTMVLGFVAVESLGLGLSAAWQCMLAFQVCRIVVFAARFLSQWKSKSVVPAV